MAAAGGEGTRKTTPLIVPALVAVVIILAGALAYSYLTRPTPSEAASSDAGSKSPEVNVTAVNVNLSGKPCSGDATTSSGSGGKVTAGSEFYFDVQLVNTAPTSGYCTFSDPVSTTAGFSVQSSNAPLTIYNGGNAVLEVAFSTPTGAWTGVVALSLTVGTG